MKFRKDEADSNVVNKLLQSIAEHTRYVFFFTWIRVFVSLAALKENHKKYPRHEINIEDVLARDVEWAIDAATAAAAAAWE